MDDCGFEVWLWPGKNRRTDTALWETGDVLTILRREDPISQWELVEVTGPGGGCFSCDAGTASRILDWMDEGRRVVCCFLKRGAKGKIFVRFEKQAGNPVKNYRK